MIPFFIVPNFYGYEKLYVYQIDNQYFNCKFEIFLISQIIFELKLNSF